ncbi:MAG: phosphoribosylglycinamide formyltransferase, partial [Pseudoxanthomonas sp.]|nr:phosphoribosylglycinamide formyltransferase [Pseudoxanthomonas sp.]
ASVHFVVPELDAGAVVAQATIPVDAGDTPLALAERLLPLEHQLVVATLALAGAGRLAERNGQVWLDGHPLLNPLRLDSSGQLSPDLQQR